MMTIWKIPLPWWLPAQHRRAQAQRHPAGSLHTGSSSGVSLTYFFSMRIELMPINIPLSADGLHHGPPNAFPSNWVGHSARKVLE